MHRTNIVITGASSGLGLGMAKQFALKNHNLALCARRVEQLTLLKEELLLINPNIKVHIYQLDVNDHEAVFSVFKQCQKQMGSIGAGISFW